MMRSLKTTDWAAKAKNGLHTVKAEFEAGQRGDDTPVQPLWASPREQLDAVLGLLHRAKATPSPPAGSSSGTEPGDETEAEAVASALRGVDWTAVRSATAAHAEDASRAVRAMAEQVDWSKVQPAAARVSSALITAIASGQLRIGGPIGSTLARTIVDQGGLAERVAKTLQTEQAPLPPDFRGDVIDTTAS
jgi:hypothetical protein